MPTYDARKAGTYRTTYAGCTDKTVVDQETGQEKTLWLWRFQELSDTTTVGEIAKLTDTSMRSPQSNAYKIAAGIMGRPLQPGDDTEVHIGEQYDVTWGPNMKGNLTIVLVTKVQPLPVPSQVESHGDKEPADVPLLP